MYCVLYGVINATHQMERCMENSLGILRLFPLSLGIMFLFSILTVHVTCTASERISSCHLKRKLKIRPFSHYTEYVYSKTNSPIVCTEQHIK